MIDAEDVVKNDPIWSDDAINIIAELPFTNIVAGVALQRLMIRVIAELISVTHTSDCLFYTDGDDIMSVSRDNLTRKKYSVSIATQSSTSTLIHIGLNITAGKKAPNFAGSLSEVFPYWITTPDGVSTFCSSLAPKLKNELNDLYSATVKVLPK